MLISITRSGRYFGGQVVISVVRSYIIFIYAPRTFRTCGTSIIFHRVGELTLQKPDVAKTSLDFDYIFGHFRCRRCIRLIALCNLDRFSAPYVVSRPKIHIFLVMCLQRQVFATSLLPPYELWYNAVRCDMIQHAMI